jgi:hypothetical protein
MTRTEELLALAGAATSPYADDWELKQALLKFDRAANPETIKQLVELVRLQNSVIKDIEDPLWEAREAFNKWENGE